MFVKYPDKRVLAFFTMTLILLLGTMTSGCELNEDSGEEPENSKGQAEPVELPAEEEFKEQLDVSLMDSLSERRSVRDYSDEKLTLTELAALLWSAQGITEKQRGYRTAPSAGATYPMEVYLVVENVEELSPGLYRYSPDEHTLEQIKEGHFNEDLKNTALGQDPIGDASVNLVITAVYERVMNRYGERGERYAKIEAGHISQNIYLSCSALELGTVAIGAFNDEQVIELLQLQEGEYPLYIMPVGKR